MKLKKTSIEWAIDHLVILSDTDLFPRPYEIDILNDIKADVVNKLSNTDIENLSPGVSRKFIVPKDDLSYRIGTQLDPLDSIILASIIYEYGNLLEERRIPESDKAVFSYRFNPDSQGHFYPTPNSWNNYWEHVYEESNNYKYALTLDISDFYNQIYHHSIENVLVESNFPNQIKKWIMNLLGSITSKMSRGVPVGPHSIHLISESVLSSIDNSLVSRGIKFVRYVDDYILFSNSEIDARKQVLIFAEILDKQQRLIVQNQKTKILTSDELKQLCSENIADRPINDLEQNLLRIIKKHSGGDPYVIVHISDLSDDEINEFNESTIAQIFEEYLKEDNPDYIRLRWILRRLSQVGHPDGITYLLKNIDRILPALNDMFKYLVSIDNSSFSNWPDIGKELVELSNSEVVKENSYYLLTIFSAFNRKPVINHYSSVLQRFNSVSPELKREIIFTALENGCSDWLRELKESYRSFDPWNKRAFLISSSQLPKEERLFFLKNNVESGNILEELISKWAKMR
ncbi:MAG: RNA-directed DNA polymerase [Methanophagales archaeon]|nr:RNA-directed DNA polymerase [Methanophagales archaeon]